MVLAKEIQVLVAGVCLLSTEIQKKNILSKDIKWINNFDNIKKGPVIFFGNEFFDAIPIKQFKKIKGFLFEKNYFNTTTVQ